MSISPCLRPVAARKNCVPAALELLDGAIFPGFPELLPFDGHWCVQPEQATAPCTSHGLAANSRLTA